MFVYFFLAHIQVVMALEAFRVNSNLLSTYKKLHCKREPYQSHRHPNFFYIRNKVWCNIIEVNNYRNKLEMFISCEIFIQMSKSANMYQS